MANVFAEGHEIHAKYQRWFRDMEILYGWWHCRSCDYRWWATCPERCEFCLDESNIDYAEVPVNDDDLMIAGAGDALVWFEERLRLVEIKSIGLRSIELDYPKLYTPYREGRITLDQLWSSVKEPFPTHIRQATLYLHVLKQMDFDVDDIIFVYEFKANQHVKMFTIGYRPEAIANILRGAREVVSAVEQGRSVRRPVWADTPQNKTCQRCPYRDACWRNVER